MVRTPFSLFPALPMKRAHQKSGGGLSRRVRFPEDESRLTWLPLLLDAYALIDTGVAIAVRNGEKERGTVIACSRGCAVCCAQKDIPVYPHELVGLYWYASEKLGRSDRQVLKKQLESHEAGSPCPFLVQNACLVHPVRPAACRWFNIFGAPCGPGEDPYYTRRGDVLVPIEDYTDRAFSAVLAFYGIKKGDDLARSLRLVRSQIMNLQTYDWSKLLLAMEKMNELNP
jgi:Fe-S-cluster containining protein